MKLKIGQRWRFPRTSLIIEINNLNLDPSSHTVVQSGAGYSIGFTSWWPILQEGSIEQAIKTGTIEYLQNQDKMYK